MSKIQYAIRAMLDAGISAAPMAISAAPTTSWRALASFEMKIAPTSPDVPDSTMNTPETR